MPPKKPRQYQKEGVWGMEQFLDQGGGTLCADDMGLGKTLQTLWLTHRSKVGDMLPTLIVCPSSVKYMWQHAALENMNWRAQVCEGRTPPSDFINHVPKLLIINPDILYDWLPYLRKINIKTLVLDECQYYIDATSRRTQSAITLARLVPYRVALSGTPLTNRPAELWPTLHMLRPDVFPSFFAYGQEYCRPKMEYGKWRYRGAKNLPKLHTLLKNTCMIRRLKKDVAHELPAKVRQVVPMDLTNRREYEEARTNFLGWLGKHYRNDRGRVQRAARAAAVTQVGYLLRLAARLKCRAVVDWANAFLTEYPNEKLVLFAVHHKMIEVLQRRVNAKHVTIDGSVTGRRRHLAVEQFRHDPEIRLLIGNIKAAGTGVDGLQEVCANAAFAEMWWVPGIHIQAEDRIYRIGQEKTAWIHYLVAGGTIEEKLCRIIQEKQQVIHAVLDGAAYKSDMDVMDLLIQEMEKAA